MEHYNGRLVMMTCNANPELAEEIAEKLEIKLCDCVVNRFRDQEIYVRINDTVRGADVFIVQPTSCPANENLMELLITIDAVRRASAGRITAVIPYYGYARQDRKTKPRDPITAKLIANLLTASGADRIVTMDLHVGQIQGFFDIPVDHLPACPIIANYLLKKDLKDVIVVSPDIGGVSRSRILAERIGAPLAIIDKRRPEPNVAEIMNLIGDVEGKTAIMIDDLIDTGGTIIKGAEAVLKRGAKEVYVCCTHGVFSEPAAKNLQESPIKEVIVTNTIALPPEKRFEKLHVLSVAQLMADTIANIHENRPVSVLFD